MVVRWWRARRARADARSASVAQRALRWSAGAVIAAGGVYLLSACAAVQTVDYYWQSAAGSGTSSRAHARSTTSSPRRTTPA